MIFNVSAGGVALNYRIRAAAAAPTAAGSLNEIVVVTAVALGDVQLNCVAIPTVRSDGTALQEGDLYMLVRPQGGNVINALKHNALYAPLGGAYQYASNAWQPIPTYRYNGSAWVVVADFIPQAFAYTGSMRHVTESATNWRIELLTSGVLTVSAVGTADIHVVGGGGGGGGVGGPSGCNGGGGAGGYTATLCSRALTPGTYAVTVGAGGAAGGGTGGTSSFAGIISAGGGGGGGSSGGTPTGGSGGSGGGVGGAGGADGASGGGGGGAGQGRTTRDFGEAGGTLRAGGGGGGGAGLGGQAGGAGGGGAGAGENYAGTSGTTNYGGGGGGARISIATGGSGIVILRNSRG